MGVPDARRVVRRSSGGRGRPLRAFVLFAAAALPLLSLALATPTGEVVLTGRISLDLAASRDHAASRSYTVLESGDERVVLEGEAAAGLEPGERVRVRGYRRGETITVSQVDAAAGSDTAAATLTTAAAPVASDKRVAVLLVNFTDPTPPPTPSPTPIPTDPPPTDPPPSDPPPSEVPPSDPPPSDPPPSDVPPTDPPPLETPAFVDPVTPEPTLVVTPDPTLPPPDPTLPPPDPTLPPPDPTLPPPPDPTQPPPDPTLPPDPTPAPTPSPTPTPPPQPWTPERVRGIYFDNTRSVSSYYAEVSEGQMAISGDVYGWYTLAIGTNACNYNAWGKAAREAAIAAGVDLSAYTNVVYAFPEQKVCWWGALANVVGRNSWINGSMSLYVTSHELGHNFGAHHANSLRCTRAGQRVAFSSNCTTDEYGDPFDIMGFQGQRHVSNWHRWQMGFLGAGDVATVTETGTYRVATAQVPGLPRILRVPRASGDYYYLEFRQPFGRFDNFTAAAAVVNGVTIRAAPDVTSIVQSNLIDTNPQTTTFSDAPLGVGRTFSDLVNQLFVTTVAVDGSGATVNIHVGPDVLPPSTPEPTALANPDGTVTISWPAVVDDVSVASYALSRDGIAVASTTATSLTDLPPLQAATYSYEVVALDQSGNQSASGLASVYLPDTTRPSAATALAALATGPNSLELSWVSATDNVGVAGYRVERDGLEIGRTEGLTFAVHNLPDGYSSSYAVVAFDAAGNETATTLVAGLADVTAPQLAGELTTTIESGVVSISWPAASDNVAVDHYVVSRGGAVVAEPGATETSFIDSGLAQALTYSYSVFAVDGAGLASAALAADVYLPDSTAPGMIEHLVAGLDGAVASLSWAAAADNVGIDYYRVLLDGTPLTTTRDTFVGGVALTDAASHTLTVLAVDAAGNVSPAAEVIVAVGDLTAPAAPVLTARAASETAVTVSWTPATDNVGVAKYVLERDGVVISEPGAGDSTFTDAGLASDRSYIYALRAVDAAGNASETVSASVTLVSVDRIAPTVPTNLRAAALGGRRVSLTWSASTDDRAGTIRYQVWRGTKRIATVTGTSFIDRPATVSIYKYRIRAVDAAGNRSAFTAYFSIKALR